MPQTIAILAAGLMGAAGVILSALGAHAMPGPALTNAGHMLLFHAASVLAGAALTERGTLWRPAFMCAMLGWIAGASLFAAAVTASAYTGNRLFAMGAPVGGTTLIVAWLALAASALLKPKR